MADPDPGVPKTYDPQHCYQPIEMKETVPVPEEEHAGASVEDLVAVGDGYLLGHLVLQVLDHEGVGLVQYSEP
jgi:hypothetical protein